MTGPKIVVIPGSTRKESLNKKLARVVAEALSKAGAEVSFADLSEYAMPIYDGDLEAKGFPEQVERFYQLMKHQDGIILVCPEYNSSMTPVLKNAIDWASRPRKGDRNLEAFQGKTAML